MIKGFEAYTHDLNEDEKEIARKVWKILTQTTEPITNAKICSELKERFNVSTSGPRVRKMINFMHVKGHLPKLIASSKGYYFASSREELNDYAKSLEGRINAIEARRLQVIKDLAKWR